MTVMAFFWEWGWGWGWDGLSWGYPSPGVACFPMKRSWLLGGRRAGKHPAGQESDGRARKAFWLFGRGRGASGAAALPWGRRGHAERGGR